MHNFYIVGTVRDVSGTVISEIETLETTFRTFGTVKFYLVESDSTDDTVKILTKLQTSKPNFSFVSLGKLEDDMPNRYQRIAFCRENYLRKVREEVEGVDFVVVADLDGMNFALKAESVANSLSMAADWDAVFANQRGRYYDIGALRHEYWSPNDCFAVMNWAKKVTSHDSARALSIQSRMIKIDESASLIPVQSAYGGLAIYKREAFILGSYIGLDQNNDHQLDFVAFNLNLHARGLRLFVDPQLINCVLNSHNAGESFMFRQLRKFSRKIPSSTLKRKIKLLVLKILSKQA